MKTSKRGQANPWNIKEQGAREITATATTAIRQNGKNGIAKKKKML